MTKFYIVNAFSLNMLTTQGYNVALRPVNIDAVKTLMKNHNPESYVGHEDTANILSNLIGTKIKTNRQALKFTDYQWSLIVCQYSGSRLEVGTTELPEGAKFEFWQVYPI